MRDCKCRRGESGMREGGLSGCWVWGCDVIGGWVGMLFQIGSECGQGWSLAVCVWHDRPAFLERDLVGLYVNGIGQIWVQYYGSETLSIHTIGEGMAGSSNVKYYTHYIEVGKLSSWTCSQHGCYGVSETSAGASWWDGEWDISYTRVYFKVGSLWGQRLLSTMSWQSLRGIKIFRKNQFCLVANTVDIKMDVYFQSLVQTKKYC